MTGAEGVASLEVAMRCLQGERDAARRTAGKPRTASRAEAFAVIRL